MKYIFLILVLYSTHIAYSQKTINASKKTSHINCDGVVNEATWLGAAVLSDFTQFNPTPGAKPTYDTEVRIVYDNSAIYVSAIMKDEEPSKILKELNNRDGSANADVFSISFDTYSDGINAFFFEVSAAGVQTDKRITANGNDSSWDAVWQSNVSINEESWSVELIIPYNALRFPNKDVQKWKVQASRELRRKRESSTWNPINPQIDGEVNQYGYLTGIVGIKSPFRLALTPYVSTYYDNYTSLTTGKNTSVSSIAAGLDLKYGINDAYTLDMTVIPDFGQVISDRQVLNVTPFEVFFQENRPFFTEGTELFNKGNLFYSRRLGGTPVGVNLPEEYAQVNNGTVVDNPLTNRLINVSKISGRDKSGLGIGVFNGIEAESFATVSFQDRDDERIKTNPLTNYSVLVVDQNLGNNSNIGITNTNVWRAGQFSDANATGLFIDLRDKSQTYGFRFSPVVSNVIDDKTITGYKHDLEFGKISGNWTYVINHTLESDKFDINDLGFLQNPNEISGGSEIKYSNYKPKNEKLILYRFTHYLYGGGLYKPMLYNDFGTGLEAFWLFKSRVGFNMQLYYEPKETYDYFEPRRNDFKYYLTRPANTRIRAYVSSDYRKPFAVDARLFYRKMDKSKWSVAIAEFSPRFRFNDKFSLFGTSIVTLNFDETGYFNSSSFNRQALGYTSDDVLLGIRDRTVIETITSARYLFNRNLGIDCRVRHYWAEVAYSNYGKLDEKGYTQLSSKPEPALIEGIQRNLNLFNIDMQLRWRFAPGSDLFVVWKNSITGSNKDIYQNYFSNLASTFDNPQNNSISIRAVYWLDTNKLIDSKGPQI